MRDIDRDSTEGAELLGRIAAEHGEGLAKVGRLSERLFALSSKWAEGLHFFGAQVETDALPGVVDVKMRFSLAGSGETAERALLSCLGEGAERLSSVEHHGDVAIGMLFAGARDRSMPAARPIINSLLEGSVATDHPVDWMHGIALDTGSEILMPADWCIRRAIFGPIRFPHTALSAGVAAGQTFTQAAENALLELIERDAVAMWWLGGRRPRPLPLECPAVTEAVRLLSVLRSGLSKRATWLLDLTTDDIAIPCLAAVSAAGDGSGLAFGFSARTTRAEAATRAILEMCQMELGLQLATLKLQQGGEAALSSHDRIALIRATKLSASRCDLVHPTGTPRLTVEYASTSGLEDIRAAFAARGIAAALVDLTRPWLGVPVVRAIAPQLQLLPSGLVSARLAAAMDETGGGARWTGGIPLP